MDLGTALVVAVVLAALIMLGGIVDVLRLGRDRFTKAGKHRWHWILLILYSGPLGVLLYAAAVRPQVAHPERYADDPADHPANHSADEPVASPARLPALDGPGGAAIDRRTG